MKDFDYRVCLLIVLASFALPVWAAWPKPPTPEDIIMQAEEESYNRIQEARRKCGCDVTMKLQEIKRREAAELAKLRHNHTEHSHVE